MPLLSENGVFRTIRFLFRGSELFGFLLIRDLGYANTIRIMSCPFWTKHELSFTEATFFKPNYSYEDFEQKFEFLDIQDLFAFDDEALSDWTGIASLSVSVAKKAGFVACMDDSQEKIINEGLVTNHADILYKRVLERCQFENNAAFLKNLANRR